MIPKKLLHFMERVNGKKQTVTVTHRNIQFKEDKDNKQTWSTVGMGIPRKGQGGTSHFHLDEIKKIDPIYELASVKRIRSFFLFLQDKERVPPHWPPLRRFWLLMKYTVY